jgi:hypothetical protein
MTEHVGHSESADHGQVLADPRPADRSAIEQLSSCRRLRKRWSDWSAVVDVRRDVAAQMVGS